MTLNGVVREFQWTYPHCYIQLLVTDSNGQQKEWAIESGTPSLSMHLGWSKESIKAGDKVTIELSPDARRISGRNAALTVTTPDGKVLHGAAAKCES